MTGGLVETGRVAIFQRMDEASSDQAQRLLVILPDGSGVI
jgi:hypothetical protein